MSSSDKVHASDEELMMKKDDDEGGKVNLSFFDNTIDESSEHEHPTEKPSMMEKPEMPSSDSAVMKSHDSKNMKSDEGTSDTMPKDDKNVLTKTSNKSFMEMEVKRDKLRWLYMSELGATFGEEKHTRDSFIKLFATRVSSKEFLLVISKIHYKFTNLRRQVNYVCKFRYIQLNQPTILKKNR